VTDSTQYPAVPLVLESWQEAHRRDAAAINFLLNRVMGASEDPDAPDTLPEHIADKDNPHEVMHAQLTDTTANDHHNKSHVHNGADGSGTVAHSDLTGRTADDHHDRLHTHTDPLDGVIDHTSLTSVGTLTHAEIDSLFTYLIAVGREYGVLYGTVGDVSAAEPEALGTWEFGAVASVDSLMTVNTGTGEFLIGAGRGGVYSVSATLVYAGSGNNVQYGVGLVVNDVFGSAAAYNLWTAQTSAQSVTITGVVNLAAGDRVGLAKIIGNTMISVSASFTVQLDVPS